MAVAGTWSYTSHISRVLLILVLVYVHVTFAQPVGTWIFEPESFTTHGVGFPRATPSLADADSINLQDRTINNELNNQTTGQEIGAMGEPDVHQTLSIGGKAVIGLSVGAAAFLRKLTRLMPTNLLL
jgi:hypothetical protein